MPPGLGQFPAGCSPYVYYTGAGFSLFTFLLITCPFLPRCHPFDGHLFPTHIPTAPTFPFCPLPTTHLVGWCCFWFWFLWFCGGTLLPPPPPPTLAPHPSFPSTTGSFVSCQCVLCLLLNPLNIWDDDWFYFPYPDYLVGGQWFAFPFAPPPPPPLTLLTPTLWKLALTASLPLLVGWLLMTIPC